MQPLHSRKIYKNVNKACVVCACLSSLESKVEGGKESLANQRRLYTCIFSERVTLKKNNED
jgi:hypothetical protein